MAPESVQRSVNSLEKIYAVIIALAIGNALQNVFSGENIDQIIENLFTHAPSLATFVLLIVPFYHGMNRHLDVCYIQGYNNDNFNNAGLLFDFFFFLIESALLFTFAAVITSGKVAFAVLGIVLVIDIVWALIAHLINYKDIKPTVLYWAGTNFVIALAGFFIYVYTNDQLSVQWILTVLVLCRTVMDYTVMWKFYFPE